MNLIRPRLVAKCALVLSVSSMLAPGAPAERLAGTPSASFRPEGPEAGNLLPPTFEGSNEEGQFRLNTPGSSVLLERGFARSSYRKVQVRAKLASAWPIRGHRAFV